MSSSSSMALAAATAVALSGSLVIFSLCRAAVRHDAAPAPSARAQLRPCLSSSEKRRRGGSRVVRKREKRVRFAEGVVDNEGAARLTRTSSSTPAAAAAEPTCRGSALEPAPRLPANREALYRGMLRERAMHRIAFSY